MLKKLFIVLLICPMFAGMVMLKPIVAEAQIPAGDTRNRNSSRAAVTDPLEFFTLRIENAYAAPNKKAQLWELFYTAILDEDARAMLIETVEKLDLIEGPVDILIEPLRPDEQLSEISHGYVYFQNLKPVGAVNIIPKKNSSIAVLRQYYGMKGGRYYLTATIRKPYHEAGENAPAPSSNDNWFYRRNRGQ